MAKTYLARDLYVHSEHYEVTLKCGRPDPEGFGFLHLFDRTAQGISHYGEFSQMAAVSDQNWDEIADIGINAALEDVPSQQGRLGDANYCYATRLDLVNRRTNQVIDWRIVITIVDPDHDSIITTYPSEEWCP